MRSSSASTFARAAFLAVAVLGVAGNARAFCRTTTVPVAPDYQPTPTKCWDQGVPLFWKNACVGYSIQRSASKQVSYDDASNGVARAFTRWTGATCPTDGTGTSRASIDVRDLGPVDCDKVNYNQDSPNQHVIVFRDDSWPHNDANNTLALTTVTFNPDTGEIYDADMEVNTHDQHMTVSDPVPADGYDFAAVVTHETGHFLGLAHSGDSHATMFAHYTPGSTAMRNLTADDVSGICTVYRPDGTRAVLTDKVTQEDACDPTPRHGFGTACAPAPAKSCAVARAIGNSGLHDARENGLPAGVMVLGVGAFVALRAARRRRTQAH